MTSFLQKIAAATKRKWDEHRDAGVHSTKINAKSQSGRAQIKLDSISGPLKPLNDLEKKFFEKNWPAMYHRYKKEGFDARVHMAKSGPFKLAPPFIAVVLEPDTAIVNYIGSDELQTVKYFKNKEAKDQKAEKDYPPFATYSFPSSDTPKLEKFLSSQFGPSKKETGIFDDQLIVWKTFQGKACIRLNSGKQRDSCHWPLALDEKLSSLVKGEGIELTFLGKSKGMPF